MLCYEEKYYGGQASTISGKTTEYGDKQSEGKKDDDSGCIVM